MENNPQVQPPYQGPNQYPQQMPSPYPPNWGYPQTPPPYQPYPPAQSNQGYSRVPPQYPPYPPVQPNQGYPPAPPNPGYPQMPPNQYRPGPPNQQASVPPKPAPVQRPRVRRSLWGNLSGPAMMLRGAIMAVIGLVLTIVSYSILSSSGGGTYVVFSGLIVIGVIYCIVGFFRWISRR